MGNRDFYSDCKLGVLLYPEDWGTTKEGALVSVAGCRGNAIAILQITEDASVATSKKLDVTIHYVASDSDTLAAANQIAAFTQVVGSNNGSGVQYTEVIAVNLDKVPDGYPYIQGLFTETSTYEGFISCIVLLPGYGYKPVNS